jgi:hypothetical protein
MTDAPRPDEAPEPPPTSPYGPADGVEQLFGTPSVAPAPDAAAAPAAAPTPHGDSPAVTRARRTLALLAIVLPLAGLALSIVALVVYTVTGGFGIDPLSEFAGLLLTFIGPTLLVLGLHMVVWRAMVRPLSRMTPGSRVGMIIGIGGVLSFLSVILVIILVFIGFMLLSLLLSATDQAM